MEYFLQCDEVMQAGWRFRRLALWRGTQTECAVAGTLFIKKTSKCLKSSFPRGCQTLASDQRGHGRRVIIRYCYRIAIRERREVINRRNTLPSSSPPRTGSLRLGEVRKSLMKPLYRRHRANLVLMGISHREPSTDFPLALYTLPENSDGHVNKRRPMARPHPTHVCQRQSPHN